MMNLELVREKGKIAVYELGFNLNDEQELILEVAYSKRGRTNKIDMIKTVIAHIYDKNNSIRIEFTSLKGKHTRALDYISTNLCFMSESRKEKYFSKVIGTRREMIRLENERKYLKYLVSNLYNLYPRKYSTQLYIDSLEKKKQSLVEQIQRISNL